ncbi:MAG: SHOCT domain-containing protein [Ktedonobacterales bacterium]
MRFRHFFSYPGAAGHLWPHLLGLGLITLLGLGLLGLLIWALLQLFHGRPAVGAPAGIPWQSPAAPPPRDLSATEILRQRYARGEIDSETYQQMLERLQASAPADSTGSTPL